MTTVLPELRKLPSGLVMDGELVAWRGSKPYFPLVARRVLNRDMSIPLTLVVFDLLRHDGEDLIAKPYRERRAVLEELRLEGPGWTTSETFPDGQALFGAVYEHGLEGVVAKRQDGRYRPGERGWVKTKNPNYWRRDLERELSSARSGAAACPSPPAPRAGVVRKAPLAARSPTRSEHATGASGAGGRCTRRSSPCPRDCVVTSLRRGFTSLRALPTPTLAPPSHPINEVAAEDRLASQC